MLASRSRSVSPCGPKLPLHLEQNQTIKARGITKAKIPGARRVDEGLNPTLRLSSTWNASSPGRIFETNANRLKRMLYRWLCLEDDTKERTERADQCVPMSASGAHQAVKHNVALFYWEGAPGSPSLAFPVSTVANRMSV